MFFPPLSFLFLSCSALSWKALLLLQFPHLRQLWENLLVREIRTCTTERYSVQKTSWTNRVRQLEAEGKSFSSQEIPSVLLSIYLSSLLKTLCQAGQKDWNFIFDKFSFEIADRRGKHQWIVTHLYLVLVWHRTSTLADPSSNAQSREWHRNMRNILLHCHIHEHSLYCTESILYCKMCVTLLCPYLDLQAFSIFAQSHQTKWYLSHPQGCC